jgi:hypothetical protein
MMSFDLGYLRNTIFVAIFLIVKGDFVAEFFLDLFLGMATGLCPDKALVQIGILADIQGSCSLSTAPISTAIIVVAVHEPDALQVAPACYRLVQTAHVCPILGTGI